MIGFVAVLMVLIFLTLVYQLVSKLKIVGANELAVVAGKGREGFATLRGGRVFVWPLIHRFFKMDLRPQTTSVRVESAIAASVILAALNNLYPLITKKLWLVAFGFGLVHGLGFANVLKDLGLPQNMLLLMLLAFNLGVEIGQLAIVCGFMPGAYRLRYAVWYPKIIVTTGSVFIAAIASVWLLERSFDLKLLTE